MMQIDFKSEHHRRLNLLAGAWDTTITAVDADGEGVVSKATDTYTWMPNGCFLVHEVDAMMGNQRVQSTEIFGVDPVSGDFFSRSNDPDGSTSDFTSRARRPHVGHQVLGDPTRLAAATRDRSGALSRRIWGLKGKPALSRITNASERYSRWRDEG